MVFRCEPPWNPSNLSFLSLQLCFSFLSGCGISKIFHFFHFNCVFQGAEWLCVFHFFQGAAWLISFVSSCFSFLSGCGMPHFFHFFVFFISFRVRHGSFLSFLCVFHFFQGAEWLISFISLMVQFKQQL